IEDGQGETLTRAARRLPRTLQDKPVTLSCLLRWVLSGVRGPRGERVRLEAARHAGRWDTSPGAIRRFVAAQTPSGEGGATAPRAPARRRKESEAAALRLATIGI